MHVSRFRYRAVTSQGDMRRGHVVATSILDVERQLAEENLYLIDCRPRRLPLVIGGRRAKVPLPELARTTSELAALLDTGVSVIDAIRHACDNTRSQRLGAILNDIARSLRDGRSLAQALTPHEETFGTVAIGMLAAAEPAGHLAPPLHDLAAHYHRLDQARQRMAKATRYPLILLLLVTAVATTMFGLVVPELAAFLQSAGGRPGLPTRLLFHAARAGEQFWPVLLAGALTGPVALRLAWQIRATRQRLQRLALALPGIGPILRRAALARAAHFLALSLKSGRDLLSAMADAAAGAGNAAVARELDTARLLVTDGMTPADAFARRRWLATAGNRDDPYRTDHRRPCSRSHPRRRLPRTRHRPPHRPPAGRG